MLVEEIRESSEVLRARATRSPTPVSFKSYAEPGGLIPWADYEGDQFLCWLADGDDPDRWPVVDYLSRDRHERIEGSTLEALIRVMLGDAGRSVFSPDLYEEDLEYFDIS